METKISSLCAFIKWFPFQTEPYSVAEASPKPRAILLLQPPKYWQYHRSSRTFSGGGGI